jgi:hypothetical protein
MRMKELFAGAALALVLSAGAYAQTPAYPCCPAGAAKVAQDEGDRVGPKLAENEATGRAPKLAENEATGRAPKLAETEAAGRAPKLAETESAGGTVRLSDGTPCRPCP